MGGQPYNSAISVNNLKVCTKLLVSMNNVQNSHELHQIDISLRGIGDCGLRHIRRARTIRGAVRRTPLTSPAWTLRDRNVMALSIAS